MFLLCVEEVCRTDVARGICTAKRPVVVMFCFLVVDETESQREQIYRTWERVSEV